MARSLAARLLFTSTKTGSNHEASGGAAQPGIVTQRYEFAAQVMCTDAGFHADQAGWHSRASTWPRDHFCRSTMAPRASWPTTWNEFLPISMPITAIVVLGICDMARSLSLAPLASFS